jgi:hypothetical protein
LSHGLDARKAMIILKFKLTLRGKQSNEKSDSSLLTIVPSELSPMAS